MSEKLKSILLRSEELEKKLFSLNQNPKEISKISKEYSDLKPIVELINKLQNIEKEITSLTEIIKSKDIDLIDFANQELEMQATLKKEVEHQINVALLPKDEDDERNAILEIRAGTGGDEAALFASTLLNMYNKFADLKGWKFEILNTSYNDIGGVKEVACLISGKGVFSQLKFESGVHRVQRIPETETNGRIHTSAATVAVLPELEEIDFQFEDKDLKIETTRASGAGGQHVNTTDSAIRIVHIPTGIVVQQQDERSQLRNKEKAIKIIRSRVYESEKSKRDLERAESRKIQIGTGDRSARIRTYNYPQNRITDHRINFSIYKILDITQEGRLELLIDELIKENQSLKLANQY
jgi:peptide chain release factor 1